MNTRHERYDSQGTRCFSATLQEFVNTRHQQFYEPKAPKILWTAGESRSMFCECIWGGGAAPSPPTPLQLFILKAYLLSPPPPETFPHPIETIDWQKGYGVVNDPFENAPFFHSCRLHMWEFPYIRASGLKPPSSFFTVFARRGNINPFFAGICSVFFFKRFFGPGHPT